MAAGEPGDKISIAALANQALVLTKAAVSSGAGNHLKAVLDSQGLTAVKLIDTQELRDYILSRPLSGGKLVKDIKTEHKGYRITPGACLFPPRIAGYAALWSGAGNCQEQAGLAYTIAKTLARATETKCTITFCCFSLLSVESIDGFSGVHYFVAITPSPKAFSKEGVMVEDKDVLIVDPWLLSAVVPANRYFPTGITKKVNSDEKIVITKRAQRIFVCDEDTKKDKAAVPGDKGPKPDLKKTYMEGGSIDMQKLRSILDARYTGKYQLSFFQSGVAQKGHRFAGGFIPLVILEKAPDKELIPHLRSEVAYFYYTKGGEETPYEDPVILYVYYNGTKNIMRPFSEPEEKNNLKTAGNWLSPTDLKKEPILQLYISMLLPKLFLDIKEFPKSTELEKYLLEAYRDNNLFTDETLDRLREKCEADKPANAWGANTTARFARTGYLPK